MNWKAKYKTFKKWQQRPYVVAPISKEEHDCPTCHTRYVGNFCPRCGQSATIGRYSFRTALLNFLNVWGIGNRSMFRTLRDLILRPGYMIRDYLMGMQMAYFPPFQMLFLLTTFSFFVIYGFNIKGQTLDDSKKEAITIMEEGEEGDADDGLDAEVGMKVFKWCMEKKEKSPTLISLLCIVFMSGLLHLFFRHSKLIPDMRYSEFLMATIYIANMMSIYEIAMLFFCVPAGWVSLISMSMAIIPLKQLSGFSWGRTILYGVLTYIVAVFVLLFLVTILMALLYLLFSNTEDLGLFTF